MRTRTLILTAAALVAGLATSFAQTYSQNIVGYATITLQPGFNLIANQFDLDGTGTNNTLTSAFSTNLPVGTQVYKFTGGGWNSSDLYVGVWVGGGAMNVNPGEGLMVNNPGGATTVTLSGQVLTGSLNTTIPNGSSIVSSQVPQAGLVQTDLGFVPQVGDQLYFFDSVGGWNTSALYVGVWVGAGEPSVGVGQAFFISSTGGTWSRTFNP